MTVNDANKLPAGERREAAFEIVRLSADEKFIAALYKSGPEGDSARSLWQGAHQIAWPASPQTTPAPGAEAAAASALAELKEMKTKRLADPAYSARFDDVKSVERKRWDELHNVAFATGDAAKH